MIFWKYLTRSELFFLAFPAFSVILLINSVLSVLDKTSKFCNLLQSQEFFMPDSILFMYSVLSCQFCKFLCNADKMDFSRPWSWDKSKAPWQPTPPAACLGDFVDLPRAWVLATVFHLCVKFGKDLPGSFGRVAI